MMGEYILLDGQPVKIGTCEDLHYCRYTDLVEWINAGRAAKMPGNDEPADYLAGAYRFRFPFPDEDGPERARLATYGAEYDRASDNPAFSRYDNRGPWVELVEQRPLDGILWPVFRCPFCAARWRVAREEGATIAAYAVEHAPELAETMRRMLAGYDDGAARPVSFAEPGGV